MMDSSEFWTLGPRPGFDLFSLVLLANYLVESLTDRKGELWTAYSLRCNASAVTKHMNSPILKAIPAGMPVFQRGASTVG